MKKTNKHLSKLIITFLCVMLTQNVFALSPSVYISCDNCNVNTMKSVAKTKATTSGRNVHVVSSPNRVVRSFYTEILSETGIYRKFAIQQSTPSTVINEINDVLDIIEIVSDLSLNGTPVSGLPGLGAGAPGSALDLPGNPTGINTIILGIARLLGNRTGAQSLGNAALSMLANGTNLLNQTVTVSFPDGSSYTFKITSFSIDAVTGEAHYSLEAVAGSGSDGDGNAIPESIGGANGFGSGMTIPVTGGPSGGISGWIGLINRFGGTVTGTPLTSTTILTCSVSGNTITCTAIPVNPG